MGLGCNGHEGGMLMGWMTRTPMGWMIGTQVGWMTLEASPSDESRLGEKSPIGSLARIDSSQTMPSRFTISKQTGTNMEAS